MKRTGIILLAALSALIGLSVSTVRITASDSHEATLVFAFLTGAYAVPALVSLWFGRRLLRLQVPGIPIWRRSVYVHGAVVACVLCNIAFRAIGALPESTDGTGRSAALEARRELAARRGELVASVLIGPTLVPVVEEITYRFAIDLATPFHPAAKALVSSAVFGAAHVIKLGPWDALLLSVVGLVFWAVYVNQGLGWAIIAHAIYNLGFGLDGIRLRLIYPSLDVALDYLYYSNMAVGMVSLLVFLSSTYKLFNMGIQK